jgi:hypothetical protein
MIWNMRIIKIFATQKYVVTFKTYAADPMNPHKIINLGIMGGGILSG